MAKIIINEFGVIPHKMRTQIVEMYLYHNEQAIYKVPSEPSIWIDCIEYKIKETGKYPIKLEYNYKNYHVKCRKTKTSIIFDIWLAS